VRHNTYSNRLINLWVAGFISLMLGWDLVGRGMDGFYLTCSERGCIHILCEVSERILGVGYEGAVPASNQ